MIGERLIDECLKRGGAVKALAVEYRRATTKRARDRAESKLRRSLPTDLALKLYFSDMGRRGGSKTSERKASAARLNGARGGRPA